MIVDLTITRADQARSPYLYVPFDVPVGTSRIDVQFDTKRSEECQLDLGLLEPSAGPFPSPIGLRGWSGGARDEFFVANDDATPGYEHGALPPGQWQVIIGLYQVPAEGTSVRLTISVDAAPRPIKPQPAAAQPVRKGAGWYRGDLHCHTYHSDAAGSPETLHAAAKQAGLDFLAVTDHNTMTQRRYFSPASSAELVFVRGMEITTGEGHANVFGVDEVVDWRMTERSDVHLLAGEVHRRGGLLSINHDKPTIPWQYELPAADCMEVWQSSWLEWNWVSLERYQRRLAAGLRLSAIGGSDFHQPIDLRPEGPFVLARPTTALFLDELSEAAILRAMKAGHGYITESPSGPHLELTVDGRPMGSRVPAISQATVDVRGARGDLLVWIDGNGELDQVEIADEAALIALAHPGRAKLFLRAEIVAKASYDRLLSEVKAHLPDAPLAKELLRTVYEQPIRRALSNPVYIGR